MSDSAERYGRLSPQKRAMLMRALASRSTAAAIPRDDGTALLSFAQERMWFLHQLDPASAAMNVYVMVRIEGPLDADRLQECLRRCVRRHESLHTAFGSSDGTPTLVLGDGADFRLERLDGPDALATAQRLVAQPYDLRRPPLVRAALLDDCLLLWMHHIVADGWSLGLLLREAIALYAGLDPAPVPIRYRDFAAWQRNRLRGERLDRLRDFWRQELAGAPTLSTLPADRARPAVQSTAGAQLRLAIPEDLTAAVRRTATELGVTPFAVLLGAFLATLSRYSGQSDLCVGVPTAGRTHPQTESLIGLFVNTLVIRADAATGSFRDLVRRVFQSASRAAEHQELPFDRLLDEAATRDLSHSPVFQVMFNLQRAPETVGEPGGLRVVPVAVPHNGTAQFDLSADLVERNDVIDLALEYCTDLYRPATVAGFGAGFLRLLRAGCAAPDTAVLDIDLLDPAERTELIAVGRGAHIDLGAATVAELIAAQARRTGDRIAVRCGDTTLTYAELLTQAGRVAGGLHARGIGNEDLVAILDERGPDLVVAVLGVLTAGAAFLPLNPDEPAGRLAQIIEDSGCRLVLCGAGQTAPAGTGTALAALTEQESAPVPTATAAPNSLAYVLYTSGSTGRPKGAMVEHAGMLNHMLAKISDLGMTEHDVLAQNGPQTFDVSVWQMLAPLLLGGRVEIFVDAIAHDPARLLDAIARTGVTVLQAVPSVLRGIIAQAGGPQPTPLPRLRRLVPTGDALMPSLVEQWFALYPDVPVCNTYGSTECSDDQCHHLLLTATDLDPDEPVVTIGTPIANMTAYVLDQRHELAPPGVAGELYIGGVGVGRGYLGDPRRTAETFLPDPFASVPGGRLYRTRDRTRLKPTGTLEFLGRIDNLVKIRGFRIEPGEIETALEASPLVREAVVLAVGAGDGDGDRRLVAYVVGEDLPADPAECARLLRTHLGAQLPDYMVPSAFIAMRSFPLNTNGKVDRARLPEPSAEAVAAEYVAPQNPIEEQLAELWQSLLGLERVGVTAGFFALGGHSLLATRMLARVEEIFGVRLPVRAVFETDTIAGLGALIAARSEPDAEALALLDQIESMSPEQVEQLLRADDHR